MSTAAPNPSGPANIGQAKWMARQALETLSSLDAPLATVIEQQLTQPQPNPAGGTLPAVASLALPEPLPPDWADSQRAPLLLGQLKALATPFYQQLHTRAPAWLATELLLNQTQDPADPANFYPWTSVTGDDSNQSVATVGQLKAVFSLRFESMAMALDDDHDGLTNAEETAHHTDPHNPDSDGDGMLDGWEVQWGLDPLNPADASADPDGDHVTNLRESQLGTSPTGIYRIEVLPVGANTYFHSAADDGSVILRDAVTWNPSSQLETVTAPDAGGQRTVVPLAASLWDPMDSIAARLVAAGALAAPEVLTACGPDSSDGNFRVFQAGAGFLVLRNPGTVVGALAPEVSWQAINNSGEAVGTLRRDVPATGAIPAHSETSICFSDGTASHTIAMPADWFPAAAAPTIQALSDHADLVVRRSLASPDCSTRHETYLLKAGQDVFTLIRHPGLDGDEITAISPANARMLGIGAKPFQITPDGTPVTLATLQIQNNRAETVASLATLYPNPLVANHIGSDGRITLTTTDANNQPTIIQIIPNNDAGANGLPDDWETSEIAYLAAANPQHWGSLTDAHSLDAQTSYWSSSWTVSQAYALGLSNGSSQLSDTRDSDQDGTADSADADPLNKLIDWKPAPETSYTVIEMERENYDGFPNSSLDTVGGAPIKLYQDLYRSASIGNAGMVLWHDQVKTMQANASASWQSRCRVWNNGVWSPDLRSQAVEFDSIDATGRYVFRAPTDYKTTTVSCNPRSDNSTQGADAFPQAICGDGLIGMGSYSGRRRELLWYDIADYDDVDNPIFEERQDGVATALVAPVAIVWNPLTTNPLDVGSWKAHPVAAPAMNADDSQSREPDAALQNECYYGRSLGSPGGAMAALGGNMTTAERTWMVWTPPQVAGLGPPTWQRPYIQHNRYLDVVAVEDGGGIAAYDVLIQQNLWAPTDRRLTVIDQGVQQTLPTGPGSAPLIHALCRVNTAKPGEPDNSRLVTAGTNLWVKKSGQWLVADHRPTTSPVLAVSNDGVMLSSRSIWRNGREVPLDQLVTDQKVAGPDSDSRFTNLSGYAMNGAGSIIALADDKLNPGSGHKTLVNLVPVAIAVDANRDGTITFDDQDKTTAEKPFRFWINNDQDDVEYDEPILVEKPDFFDRETIATKRDLEDFCRLTVQIGISNQQLRDGDLQIGLMFQNSSEGSPGIRIWKNQSPTGSMDYLEDDTAASAQIKLAAFEKFPPEMVTLIPKSYWESREDSIAHLIFEGTTRGTGKLVVTIHDKYGTRIGNSSGIWMKLLDVRQMYQRARIVNEPEQIPDPWVNANPPAQTWRWDPWNWPYYEDPDAAKITAVFVHGWRLKYMDYMNWSDTSYKRLWHQGFKGKFYSFRWPCFSGDNNGIPYGADEKLEAASTIDYLPIFPPGGTTYNASEYRAWLCGPALADFVNQLPNPGKRCIFSHSMGNVITGSALKSRMSVQFYAMCNSAMAAMAYDSNPILKIDPTTNKEWAEIFNPLDPDHKTPDNNHDPAIRNGYGLENKFNSTPNPTVFSFGLPNDQCLGKWSLNNLYFKPNLQYLYEDYSILKPFPLVYQATPVSPFRSVTSLPEAMGYITKSITRTAGADLRTVGAINGRCQDMSNWGPNASHAGFGKNHSAQWRWNNQSTHLFWQMLIDQLELR